MNLGGTEKALLSFLDSLENKDVIVTLLLQEEGGVLFDQIPDWVTIKFLKGFEQIKPIIYDPPLNLIKKSLQEFKLFSLIKHLIRYLKIKITGSWYYNYQEALRGFPIQHKTDIAIAYAGPSDFVSYYIHKCVEASEKIQWIHFDVRKIIFNKNFGNTYYPFFNYIFCVSENAKFVFDEMFPQFISKTKVFKNIISKIQLENLANEGETYSDNFNGIRILTLGRLSPEKGQQMIPNIVKKLKEQHLKFRWYLVGDGELLGDLKAKIKQLEINNELVLLGSKINPYRFVKECDIYVQTSFHEGYCLTVHEAKIFNKPVVVTNVASASNLIMDNEDGLIVGINEQGIFEGVKALLIDEEKRTLFAKNILAQETVGEINKLAL